MIEYILVRLEEDISKGLFLVICIELCLFLFLCTSLCSPRFFVKVFISDPRQQLLRIQIFVIFTYFWAIQIAVILNGLLAGELVLVQNREHPRLLLLFV